MTRTSERETKRGQMTADDNQQLTQSQFGEPGAN